MSVEMLSASLEDYLEAIYHLISEKQAARVKDISKKLEVNYSSVTGALKALATRKLINYAPYSLVTLTSKGEALARDVVRRHEVLRDFFVKVLSIDEKHADKAACEMEHAVSPRILERFVEFVEFVETCPRGGSNWIKGFGYHCDHDDTMENCEKCVANILKDIKQKKKDRKLEQRMTVQLSKLTLGLRGKIIKIGRGIENRRRMVEMGITPGALVEVERVAPLGDPIDIKVKGYHISLRKSDASKIMVEKL
jgi:DtxR family Mn-dependent transcriptional regulator